MSVDFTGVTLPFDPTDLLTSGMGLLGIVGGFLLLAMAFGIAPKFFTLIRSAFTGRK